MSWTCAGFFLLNNGAGQNVIPLKKSPHQSNSFRREGKSKLPGGSLWTFLPLVCGHHIRPGNFEMLSCLNKSDLCGLFKNWMTSLPRPFFSFLKVPIIPTRLCMRAFQSCKIWYDDHRPKIKTFLGLLPGNFEMLSCLNELDLCTLFKNRMTTWPRQFFSLKIPHTGDKTSLDRCG